MLVEVCVLIIDFVHENECQIGNVVLQQEAYRAVKDSRIGKTTRSSILVKLAFTSASVKSDETFRKFNAR